MSEEHEGGHSNREKYFNSPFATTSELISYLTSKLDSDGSLSLTYSEFDDDKILPKGEKVWHCQYCKGSKDGIVYGRADHDLKKVLIYIYNAVKVKESQNIC